MLFHLDFTGLNFNRVNFTKHRSESRGQFLLSRAFDSLHLTWPWKLLKTCNCEIKVQRLWKTLKKRNAEKSQHQSLCDLHCQVSEQKCPTAANVLKCLRRQIFENFNRGKHFGCQVWLDFMLACSPLGHFAPYSIAHLSGSAWQCLAQDSHMLHTATRCYMLLHCSRGKRHKAPDRFDGFDGFDGFDDFDDFDDFLILVADMSTLCVSCGWWSYPFWIKFCQDSTAFAFALAFVLACIEEYKNKGYLKWRCLLAFHLCNLCTMKLMNKWVWGTIQEATMDLKCSKCKYLNVYTTKCGSENPFSGCLLAYPCGSTLQLLLELREENGHRSSVAPCHTFFPHSEAHTSCSKALQISRREHFWHDPLSPAIIFQRFLFDPSAAICPTLPSCLRVGQYRIAMGPPSSCSSCFRTSTAVWILATYSGRSRPEDVLLKEPETPVAPVPEREGPGPDASLAWLRCPLRTFGPRKFNEAITSRVSTFSRCRASCLRERTFARCETLVETDEHLSLSSFSRL